MKCPKCGYNSFEFHDTCKKCNSDLSAFKETHGIRSILIPTSPALKVEEAPPPKVEDDTPEAVAETGGIDMQQDTFTWNTGEEGDNATSPAVADERLDLDLISSPTTEAAADSFIEPTANAAPPQTKPSSSILDEFSFESTSVEPPPFEEPAKKAAGNEEGFANLLETTEPVDSTAAGHTTDAAQNVADFESTFSFDEPDALASTDNTTDLELDSLLTDNASQPADKKGAQTDNFDDLFGDMDNEIEK